MKKILCIVLSMLVLSAIISYSISSIAKASEVDKSETSATSQQESDTAKKETSQATEKATQESTSTTNNNSNNTNSTELQTTNKNVLRRVSTGVMNVPKALRSIVNNDNISQSTNESIQATAITYDVGGNIVDWAVENDIIYVITKWNNHLTVINSTSRTALCYASLAAVPSEINITEDRIYVALPSLKRIDVFSKNDCQLISSYSFEHEVSSFCVDGVYIYYADNEGWCHVYRKNLVTHKVIKITQNNSLFHEPKLLLNKEDGILYIGEANYTGSVLYYYDAETLNFKSKFVKNNYGIYNKTREIFHVDDNVYWGSYCFSDTNAEEIKCEFGTPNTGSMLYASQSAVFTEEGIFNANTYEYIVRYSEWNFDFKEIVISETGNIFVKRNTPDETIIINIKF